MNTATKILPAVVSLFDKIEHAVPTSDNVMESKWKIGSSSLSCGLIELQGWSSGIGIASNNDFEKKLTQLLFWSVYQSKFKGKLWGTKYIEGEPLGPIHVPRRLSQFLHPRQNYLHSSEKAWIDRFEKFVKDNDLGTYTRTATLENPNYHKHAIEVAVWTWNGNLPKDHAKILGAE
jgi:hypothetical protein